MCRVVLAAVTAGVTALPGGCTQRAPTNDRDPLALYPSPPAAASWAASFTERMAASVAWPTPPLCALVPGQEPIIPHRRRIRALARLLQRTRVDGLLVREEFVEFIQKRTIDSRLNLTTLLSVPVLAMVTKRMTKGFPGMGKVVSKPSP
uniref:Uncharacterized protein n=1 Tax=Setaria italica TaxID=4555 RepID=K4AKI8_SETIT